ncbi:uncharacterized protein [Phyllobates terribilis]|uniref:uncharacterized protein n=1 Tax=Phyllobates terribilis TaxID=111132 RepID=UPI003CCA83C2
MDRTGEGRTLEMSVVRFINVSLHNQDYTLVKKTSSERCQAPVSEVWERPLSPIKEPPPHPLIQADINEQKILELAYKMIELLTGEVPMRSQDVAVYFSMEEWEYLEGHKDLYKDVMMEVSQPVTSPDDCTKSSEGLWIFPDLKDEHVTSPGSNEEHPINPDNPSVLQSNILSSDSFEHVVAPNSLETVEHENFRRNVEHQMAQTEEKPFSCLECKKSYKLKSTLVIHQRIHKRVFACRDCGKCFSQKADLVIHASSHTEKKIFPCPACEKYFGNKTTLLAHTKIHMQEKPFQCLICGKPFNLSPHLLIHMKTHLKEKPFSCSECAECFSCQSTLFWHLRTHRGEKPCSK